MNKDLNEKIIKLVSEFPCSYSTMLFYGRQYANLLAYINESTKDMPDDISMPAKIFYTLTGAKEPAKCKVCGNDIPHDRKCNALTGYKSLCCSRRCAQLDPDHVKRQEELSMSKYGTRKPQMSERVKDKMKATLAGKPDEFWENAAEKRRMTNIERYGTDSISKVEAVRARKSEAMLQMPDEKKKARLEKTRLTKLERYGNEKFVNTEKAKETVAENAGSNPDYWTNILEKRRKSCIGKYGVDHPLKIQSVKDRIRLSRIRKSFDEYISKSEYVQPMFDADYYAAHRHDDLPWKCRECGGEFTAKAGDQMYFPARCLKCHPLHEPVSRPEKEMAEFIKSIYEGEILENDRTVIKPSELDVFLPAKKIAFELDGLPWHSEEMGTPPGYHLSKTEKCEAAEIQLVHVTEAEWICKQEITKSRIKALLGVYDEKIYARKCEVREITAAESKNFQIKNHIQGYAPAKVNIGLFNGGELVSLMTFGKCRFDRKHEWELTRFCSRLNVRVVGAAGKLLAYFEKKYSPVSIVSYADRRWSRGKLYNALGFKLDHASRPDYWYWNRKKGVYMPESRVKYQKHKLPGLLPDFNPELSESENMKRAGFMKIYDCGNLVFVKQSTSEDSSQLQP